MARPILEMFLIYLARDHDLIFKVRWLVSPTGRAAEYAAFHDELIEEPKRGLGRQITGLDPHSRAPPLGLAMAKED